jgi:hypothetical protein
MARPARFERATAWFVARYSIQLSYGRLIVEREFCGFLAPLSTEEPIIYRFFR